MPSYDHGTAPPWVEGDSIRETTLHLYDQPRDRAALRRVGRLLYDLMVFDSNMGLDREESVTQAELRAAAVDLRYTAGYLRNIIRQSAEDCDLDPEDDKLAHFAGKLSRQVGALVDKIERRLS
jgi:hypothetical protein